MSHMLVCHLLGGVRSAKLLRVTITISLYFALPFNAATDQPNVEQLSWLAGCWEMVSGERIVEERWMPPRGQTMLGTGRTVRGDKTIDYEFVVLRANKGQLEYEAHPSGQPSASFLSIDVGTRRVVFANPAHDFPQRIGYENKEDGLLAWIEGTVQGSTKRLEFPYRRVPCS